MNHPSIYFLVVLVAFMRNDGFVEGKDDDPTCPSGKYLAMDARSGASECLTCPYGTFQRERKHRLRNCSACYKADQQLGEGVYLECEPSYDTIASCNKGFYAREGYWLDHQGRQCAKCGDCDGGILSKEEKDDCQRKNTAACCDGESSILMHRGERKMVCQRTEPAAGEKFFNIGVALVVISVVMIICLISLTVMLLRRFRMRKRSNTSDKIDKSLEAKERNVEYGESSSALVEHAINIKFSTRHSKSMNDICLPTGDDETVELKKHVSLHEVLSSNQRSDTETLSDLHVDIKHHKDESAEKTQQDLDEVDNENPDAGTPMLEHHSPESTTEV